jgi:hypothetical protein
MHSALLKPIKQLLASIVWAYNPNLIFQVFKAFSGIGDINLLLNALSIYTYTK